MTALRPVPLSVLDVLPVDVTSTPAATLDSAREIAQHVEGLGFTRYWVAEHHNAPSIASSSPTVTLAALGSATTTIRLGSGGVMLPNHVPYVVAEQFGTLNALYPNRIDVGIGRSSPSDPHLAAALHRRAPAGPVEPARFEDDFDDLVGFLTGRPTATDRFGSVRAYPHYTDRPSLWVLGSSLQGAAFAAARGLPYAFGHHFNPGESESALRLYRESFRPSEYADRPHAIVSVGVVCAADDATAHWLIAPAALAFALLVAGLPPEPFATPEQAANHPWTDPQREMRSLFTATQAVGSPETVRAKLADILERTGADELMLTTQVTDTAARARSMTYVHELFADAAQLVASRQ